MQLWQPPVVVTDRELALVNAINNVPPETYLLLCRLQVQKNGFKIEFETAWQRVLNSITE